MSKFPTQKRGGEIVKAMKTDKSAIQARRALVVSAAFYVLIAFEFLYMASPFAAYFYAVYGPGLDWLQSSGTTGWLIQFFLPHVVEETTSLPVDVHEHLGSALMIAGLAGFAIGAIQVYVAKLRGRGAVTGGLYRHIRHPQYLALIVASIGMMLIWPRYLVVVATVTVIFIYIALARAEEGICLRRFPGYADYLERTGMFLPARFGHALALPARESRLARLGAWALAYGMALGLALFVAFGIRIHAIDALHVHEDRRGIYLSVIEISDKDLAAVAELARSAPEVERALAGKKNLINYVLPTAMYVSEIPMTLPPGERYGHTIPRNRDTARYKVIFTEAVFDGDGRAPGGDILRYAVHKKPLWEAHVNLRRGQVTASLPPAKPFYGNRQVPLF